jgi:N-acetylglucosamine malate deacetylase 1
MFINPKKIVVITPHPDDEVLGLGATISRFADMNIEVSILVVSGHLPPLYNQRFFNITKIEAEKAFKIMNVTNWEFLEIPATTVHQVPVAELNSKINNFLKLHNPDWVFIPFPDRHIDHRTIFDSSIVSCRPINKNFPKVVLAYETLSETHWNVPGIEPAFIPDLFIDTSNYMKQKEKALNCYNSQIDGNSSRSVEACMALAKFRGSQNGCDYAEAFKVVRIVI